MSSDAGISSGLPFGMDRLSGRARPEEGGLVREEIFEILSNERRRLVLRYLRDRESDHIDFRDLVDQVAAWENGTSKNRLGSSDRKCVYTALRQTHLPKLHQFGVVEFDQRRGYVERTDDIEAVYPYMDYVPEHERFRSRFHLSLAVGGVLSALLAWIGTATLGGVPELLVIATFAIALGASTTVYWRISPRASSRIGPKKLRQ